MPGISRTKRAVPFSGHASIQTTMDRYGHLLPVDRVGVGARLDNLVFNSPDRQVRNLKVKSENSSLQTS